ncbi:MAG: type 1 glutamine amidotransferase [Rhodocyclaceae bacterium]|nr:type 1 glutamine amidotransferase [Rhodocyclaceae bacterium]
MKPVAVFRHSPGEGPGYFATFLEARSVPWLPIRVDAGEAVPADPSAFSGLVFMGGPMSVNDPLPWVEEECALIRAAVAADIPVLGHCLGGQLMAKALGGEITRNPVKEIGWGEVSAADNDIAREWLGDLRAFLSFHWHGETFSIPEGASLLLGNRHCPHQAFALGKHLAMQCHVEMTEAMIRLWNSQWAEETRGSSGPAIQTPEEMYQDLTHRLAGLNAVASKLYTRWIAGLS